MSRCPWLTLLLFYHSLGTDDVPAPRTLPTMNTMLINNTMHHHNAPAASTLGYDVGIMAAAIQPLEQDFDLSGVQKEVAMGSLNFVAACK